MNSAGPSAERTKAERREAKGSEPQLRGRPGEAGNAPSARALLGLVPARPRLRCPRGHPAVGTFVFFVAAPGSTAGLVPWLVTGWDGSGPCWDGADVLGVLVGLLGLGMLVACFVRFVREGRGTPAPTAPTEELVVGGL